MADSSLTIFGDVLDILEGRSTPDLLKPIAAANFRFALGGATFSNEHHIGETLIIDGITHISWVQNGKVETKKGLNATSPFLMGITKGAPPCHTAFCSATTLEAFYSELMQKYPNGIALAGKATMTTFEGVYLKKAPIYRENINTHHDTYWSPINKLNDVTIFLFGVIVPPKLYPHGFYQNPNDKGNLPFQSHTHAALMDNQNVTMIYHMLTQSIIKEGEFTLFPLANETS